MQSYARLTPLFILQLCSLCPKCRQVGLTPWHRIKVFLVIFVSRTLLILLPLSDCPGQGPISAALTYLEFRRPPS
ncbi:hypothetical protein BDV35DRAFT_362368 [Aspergillus flavus]|uniref:Uncharacterized protein n=1 Tax=Aspergillus flavus TaxID=5059 RepID=A0A5N6GPJ5_ASPFL|nr:hypothetical protein BDV35DRAFT_362368 [Aspergillus flavus]